MDNRAIAILAKSCLQVLDEILPALSNDWWEDRVVRLLTFQQQQLVAQNHLMRLDQLDLAALLRTVDQNWHELARKKNWPIAARNWLKEAQTIRNRWAHAPVQGLPNDDRYRDLDTLVRLLGHLGCSPEDLAYLQREKDLIFSAANGQPQLSGTSSPENGEPELAKGSMVALKAQPSVLGVVIDHLPGDAEDRYQVFINNAPGTYYRNQLLAMALPKQNRIAVEPDALHAALTALQLIHPSTGHLYSLFASRINFVPYQFRPVLKLIQADRPRLLIADEVGVGKTIEAGLILKELQARRDLRSVLVICPKALVAEHKWQEEMKRFDEQFVHLDGPSLRYCIDETHLDGVWPQQYQRAILPYSLFDETLLMGGKIGRSHQRGLLELDPPPAFDLVIVDEAHHIRNTDTWAYRCVRHFCDNADAVVLLSATPIQLGDNDLYTLLHLLRGDLLPDRRAFDQMAEPNPHINAAIDTVRAAKPGWRGSAQISLLSAAGTAWGRGVLSVQPALQEANDLIRIEEEDDSENRIRLVSLLEGLYTFSSVINRTRRRDIGNFTTRKPETIAVDFTSEQSSLHYDLLDLISRIMAHRHGDGNLQFMMTTIRRQLASCVFGLAPLLESILQRQLSQIEVSEANDGETVPEFEDTLFGFSDEVKSLIDRASKLRGPDPKFEAFCKVVRDKQRLPNNKLLVFSTFRHTLKYLLKMTVGEPVRVGIIHGDIPDDERRDLRQRFSLGRDDPKALDLLFSSEVGCEGLDFQFCDGLVNYDLPWNPMRVEQRIGRIDRYGQKSETVAIYNFITPGTVDAEIYERCLMRIGVFRQALGGSEEILGKLTREIHDIAENFQLSPEEQASRLQQLADNEIRIIHEQAKLEEEQSKLFGLHLPKSDDDLVHEASSYWLSPAMLANLVERYLALAIPNKPPRALSAKPVVTLQISQEGRDRLLTDFKSLKLTGATARTWERWLKGSDPYLSATFDAATASERRDLVFINPTHPLARQAAHAIDISDIPSCNLRVVSEEIPVGRYPYAIYRWQKYGLRDDFTFQPICLGNRITERFLDLLIDAQSDDQAQGLSSNDEKDIESIHYHLWSNARAEQIESVRQQAEARLASLATSHSARVADLESKRDQACDEKIRRMRNAQIESAQRDFEARTQELRLATERGDIVAQTVAFGVLSVVRN